MTLRQLRWVAIVAPVVFLATIEIVRNTIEPALFRSIPGYVLTGGIVLIGTLFFAEALFSVIGRMQERLSNRNRELLALHEAGLSIASELDLDAVLQRIVEQARELVGSRYGALSLLREQGGIESFLTSGLSQAERDRIGPLPVGHGLLGVVLIEGERLRLPNLGSDPRSVGFPPNHPPMHSLLAVPIIIHGTIVGNLYLTEKEGNAEFSGDDEEVLDRFATQAAVAIDNARLHRKVQAIAITEERERIAREMHDGVAQVLGYVNTKAQAAQELLAGGQSERAAGQIAQLAEAARDAYADVRENILGLRTSLGSGRGFVAALREYADLWEQQTGIAAEVTILPPAGFGAGIPPVVEVQFLRIVQEALANVRKHAHASQVEVVVTESEDAIEARISDDGDGFDPAALQPGAFPRFGLATMRERAEGIGGTLEIVSSPGRGTMVTARVPIAGHRI
jgi:signal transduction histidine kinase